MWTSPWTNIIEWWTWDKTIANGSLIHSYEKSLSSFTSSCHSSTYDERNISGNQSYNNCKTNRLKLFFITGRIIRWFYNYWRIPFDLSSRDRVSRIDQWILFVQRWSNWKRLRALFRSTSKIVWRDIQMGDRFARERFWEVWKFKSHSIDIQKSIVLEALN